MVRAFAASSLAVALFLTPVAVTTQDLSSPERAAVQLMESTRVHDWDAMADLMHPSALAELHELLGPLLDRAEAGELRILMGIPDTIPPDGLSDAELFAAFMRFVMEQQPEVLAALESASLAVLGVVMEGDTAHVVTRTTMQVEGIAMSQLDVMSLCRLEGRWLGLLKGDVSGLALALQQAFRDAKD